MSQWRIFKQATVQVYYELMVIIIKAENDRVEQDSNNKKINGLQVK